MDSVLVQLINKIDEYIGGLIDVSSMPTEDKVELKNHLLQAQIILLRNGNNKLQELIDGIAGAILNRL